MPGACVPAYGAISPEKLLGLVTTQSGIKQILNYSVRKKGCVEIFRLPPKQHVWCVSTSIKNKNKNLPDDSHKCANCFNSFVSERSIPQIIYYTKI